VHFGRVRVIGRSWLKVIKAEHSCLVIVGEKLRIPSPSDDGAEGLLGVVAV